MKSSYILRNYGQLFKALVTVVEPGTCVEVGLLDGYSMLITGEVLRRAGKGHLYAYDLFEDYPYTHARKQDLQRKIDHFGLSGVVTLRQKDMVAAAADFADQSLSMIHIDISNTGAIVRQAVQAWDPKLRPGGLLIFEGGSPLRDKVGWMERFGKEPIFPEIHSNPCLNRDYTFIVLHPAPSLVICCKNLTAGEREWQELGYEALTRGNLHSEASDEDFLNDLFGR